MNSALFGNDTEFSIIGRMFGTKIEADLMFRGLKLGTFISDNGTASAIYNQVYPITHAFVNAGVTHSHAYYMNDVMIAADKAERQAAWDEMEELFNS